MMLGRFRVRVRPDPAHDRPPTPAVTGGPEPLGAWEPHRALTMHRGPDGVWEATASLPRRFAYRFLLLDADGHATPEAGITRQADLQAIRPGPDGVRQLDNHWEATTVRFVAEHPLPHGEHLAVVGGHARLGGWRAPQPMALAERRAPRRGGTRACWEALVPFTEPVGELAYRYVVQAEQPRWEREPDRHVAVPHVTDAVNGIVEAVDSNIVTDLDLHRVLEAVWVGPCLQAAGDVDALASAGITAVLNLQTDEDLRDRGVDLDRVDAELRPRGITLHRLPIRDFDEADLARQLPRAVATLRRLAEADHCVYVHCTAGMGRAPAVILAYLVQQGYDLPQAQAVLRDQHPASAPNVDAVTAATQTRDGEAADPPGGHTS